VIIFACCFVGIHQGRISPVSVVSWGSLGTVLGWVMWDWWVGKEEAGGGNGSGETSSNGEGGESGSSASSTTGSVSHGTQVKDMNGVQGLGLKFPTSTTSIPQRPSHSHSASATSVHSNASLSSPAISPHGNGGANFGHYHGFHSQHGTSTSIFSPRNQQRLATAKSAILIYYALLGLSPILKSLTRSTTSDSIWAMSAWLMCINVFFFDYGGEVK
jgi:phosphatidylinositol glycan class C protein